MLDSANHFIKVYTIPDEMAQRMREFLHQRKALELRAHASHATLPTLSPALQIEAIMHIHSHWVKAIWFVRPLEEICCVRLAMAMTTRVLAPAEIAPTRVLYVVQRGVVLYGGRCFSRGMAWGDDVILENPRNFLPFSARSMTYVDVMQIGRETLLETVRAFPVSAHLLRRAQIKLALKRYFIAAARAAKAADRGEQNGQMGLGISDRQNVSLFEVYDSDNRPASGAPSPSKMLSVDMAVALEEAGRQQASRASRKGASGSGVGGGSSSSSLVDGGLAALKTEVQHMRNEMKAEMATLHASIEELSKSVLSPRGRGERRQSSP